MGQKFRVKATATLPTSKSTWEVDLGEDPQQALIYTNLGYDLIAVAMAKLGVAMSEHILGDSTKLNALAADAAAGRVD